MLEILRKNFERHSSHITFTGTLAAPRKRSGTSLNCPNHGGDARAHQWGDYVNSESSFPVLYTLDRTRVKWNWSWHTQWGPIVLGALFACLGQGYIYVIRLLKSTWTGPLIEKGNERWIFYAIRSQRSLDDTWHRKSSFSNACLLKTIPKKSW